VIRAGGMRRAGTALVLAPLLAAMLCSPAETAGQTAFGSQYYGEIRPPAPPRVLAVGGVGALRPWGGIEPSTVGYRNPALAAYAEHILFGFSWEIGKLSGDYPDGKGSLLQTGPRMTGIIAPFGWGLAAEITLTGLTSSEFEVHSEDTDFNGIPMRFDYMGSGGLNMGTVALAWAHPGGRAAVGVSAGILFGSLKKEWQIEFLDSTYRDTWDKLDRQHSGRRWTVGVEVEPLSRLRLGAVLSTGADLDVTQIYTSSNTAADTSSAEMALGGEYLVGAGFRLSDLWAVYTDYRRDLWDETAWNRPPVESGGVGSGTSDFSGFAADWDIGFGVERQARPVEEQARLIDTFPIRAGVRWGEIYAPDLDGGRVSQFYATLGSAFAMGRGGRIWGDLAIQIGKRSGSAGYSETFWRIQLGMTGAEEWFQPPQR